MHKQDLPLTNGKLIEWSHVSGFLLIKSWNNMRFLTSNHHLRLQLPQPTIFYRKRKLSKSMSRVKENVSSRWSGQILLGFEEQVEFGVAQQSTMMQLSCPCGRALARLAGLTWLGVLHCLLVFCTFVAPKFATEAGQNYQVVQKCKKLL